MKKEYPYFDTFNFGVEYEFFAINNEKKHVYNANHLIHTLLGVEFDISESQLLDNRCPTLLSNSRHELIGDGTPFEIISKYPVCYSHFGWYHNELWRYVKRYREYVEKTFNVETLLTPFISKDDGWEFINPGYCYSSQKITFNAYTGEGYKGFKKEDDLVSFRPAGFHIHTRFENKETEDEMFKGFSCEYKYTADFDETRQKDLCYKVTSPTLCNELVKQLDYTYLLYLNYLSKETRDKELLRNKEYAKLGNYRIKEHIGGYKTLEYRQFSSAFLTIPLKAQQEIFSTFRHTINEFLKKNFA